MLKALEQAERFSKLCKAYGFPERDLSTLIVLTRRAVHAYCRQQWTGRVEGTPLDRARRAVEKQAVEMLIGVEWSSYIPTFKGGKPETAFTLPFLES